MTERILTGFEQAFAEYRAGNFIPALSAAESALPLADDFQRQALLPLKASIHLKLGEKRQGAEAFIAAARLMPDKKADFLKFAVTLFLDEGRDAEVMEIAGEAAACRPADSEFLLKLAMSCKRTGNLPAARSFIAGLDLSKPAHFLLFCEFEQAIGNPEAFYKFLCEACAIHRENVLLNSMRYAKAHGMCDFPALEEFHRLVSDTHSEMGRTLLRHELALFRLMRTADERQCSLPTYETALLQDSAASERPLSRRPISGAGRKLRIGYLSSDFCVHVTMRLFEEVLFLHDREKFDIRLFCYTPEVARAYQKTWPQDLQDATTVIARMSDADAARCIDAQDIDILVDLKGHTAGARLGIVNRSDSPLKATYLGYPGSVTGIDLDYALTDAVVTPDSSKAVYAEKLCRLPETYQANGSARRSEPLPMSRSDFGMPDGKIILGSFNAAHKITDATLRSWAKILRRLPDAHLSILCRQGAARESIRSVFCEENIDTEKLLFFGHEPYARYLTRIALVDIALDINPCNGHTTSSDILWVGTPLVTFRGSSFAARVSESLLAAIDVPELVASDETDYCDLAVELAGDPDRLRQIRARLQYNRRIKPLFDTERFTRHLESAYQMMAERARNGLPPDHIDVPPLPGRTASF